MEDDSHADRTKLGSDVGDNLGIRRDRSTDTKSNDGSSVVNAEQGSQVDKIVSKVGSLKLQPRRERVVLGDISNNENSRSSKSNRPFKDRDNGLSQSLSTPPNELPTPTDATTVRKVGKLGAHGPKRADTHVDTVEVARFEKNETFDVDPAPENEGMEAEVHPLHDIRSRQNSKRDTKSRRSSTTDRGLEALEERNVLECEGLGVLLIKHNHMLTDIERVVQEVVEARAQEAGPRGRWEQFLQSQAAKIVARANNLRDANEPTWRDDIENLVLLYLRLDSECPICEEKLWLSIIDPCIMDDQQREKLEKRRVLRKACDCSNRDFNAIKDSTIFQKRLDEFVHYRDVRPNRRPDLIYGLSDAEMLRNLFSTAKVAVTSSPFRKGLPPHFPFLLLEAKSEENPEGFPAMFCQAKFSILKLLLLQENLQKKASVSAKGVEPFVWFLTSNGTLWRLYACYLLEKPLDGDANIEQYWEGNITTMDSVIELLHLVNHIFMWARDIYRPNILKQLTDLNAEPQCYRDTEISSDRSTASPASNPSPASNQTADRVEAATSSLRFRTTR